MSAIEQGLYEFLRDTSGVSAQVSGRVWPMVSQQEATTPYIVYQRISTVPDYAMGGSSIKQARFQIDAWGSTYEAAKAAGEAVRTALDFKSGALGSASVELIEIADQRDDYDEAARLYRDSTDFFIRYQ